MKQTLRTLFFFLSLITITASAFATMNIHTSDGKTIQVPVNKRDVIRITYNDGVKPPQASGDTPWVVNDSGNIYRRTGNSWQQLPGLAKDIGVGADGTVWVIGHDRVPGGFGIHRWNGSNWYKIDGGAVRIAVAPDGTPWVVNDAGNIYRRTGNSWQQLPGLAKDIGVGADGTVWVIGHDRVLGGFGIHRWNDSNWYKIDGGAVRIAVDPDGIPLVVNDAGNIYRRTGNNWQQLPGLAKDIGVGADGTVWVIGHDRVPGGFGIHRWNGSSWKKIEGGALEISVR